MPKQACCCNPVGRHIAIACRYYGRSVIYSLNGDVGATSGAAGASGSTGGSTNNLITGIEYGYGGDDGFIGITSGIQKFFGWTAQEPAFGNDQSGYIHRGPVKWTVDIKQFDTTRDVVLLSRSGGGGSQYEYDEAEPKGGHSALLQSRVKASLALEGFAGIGGNNFSGGLPTIASENLAEISEPSIVGGGAGGAGGAESRGGYGGITYGYRGDGSFGGYGGSQTSPGLAGGPSAFAGVTLFGGSGANDGGGGGGGRYAGGGGDKGSGGGGGASKWPTDQGGSSFDDVNYSEDASDRGPGGVCDPFINYYPLDTLVYGWHAGMGGGANVIFDSEADQNLNSSTRFLGFGYDYNPFKQGIPGIITAIWVDKYCPCSEIADGATGGTGGIANTTNQNEEESTQTSNSSTELPAKMYICLTDEQYQVLENFKDPENEELNVPHPRFTLNGESYIYVGVCVNSYCPSIRLVEGTPTNLAKTDLGGNGAASFNGTYNDCCDVMICSRYCKIPEADCYSCRCNTTCITDFSKPKYCCENLDEKPDQYWSKSEGWLWWCRKVKKFWYPFGVTPEDTLPATNELSIDGMLVNGPFEKGCLPITATGLCGSTLEAFINSNCFPENPNLNCSEYIGSFTPDHPCRADLPKKQWDGKVLWPINVNADICANLETVPLYAFSTSLPVDCSCAETESVLCAQLGCPEETNYTFSFQECDFTAIEGGYYAIKRSGCSTTFTGPTSRCEIFYSLIPINGRFTNLCKEVLGMTIRIPRCHPDPNNPQIGDTPKYGIPGIGNAVTFPQSTLGFITICEKTVQGYGTLGEFVSELTSNMQSDIEITVNEPRLWLSRRPKLDSCNNTIPVENFWPSDLVSRVKITETLDFQILEYFFIPAAYIFQVDANVNVTPSGNYREYLGDDPVCNPDCLCQSEKSFQQAWAASTSSRYSYFSSVYYLYENSSGAPPDLVRGIFQSSPEFGNSPDNGFSVLPPFISESCEIPVSDVLGLAIRSKSSCATFTVGSFPDCNITSTIENNSCYPDFLNITFS